jgi:hypothetical protein
MRTSGIVLAACVLLELGCEPLVAQAQQTVQEFFKGELGLSFIVIPRSKFGVGAVIQGRGKELTIWAWPQQCIPDIEERRKSGAVQESKLAQVEQTGKWERKFKVSQPLLRLLGISFGMDNAKYVKVVLTDPVVEEVSLSTLRDWAVWGVLGEQFRDDLESHRRPRREIVVRALKASRMGFEFTDRKDITVELAEKTGKAQDGLTWNRGGDGTLLIESPAWLAFRSATLERGNPKLTSAVHTGPGIIESFNLSDVETRYERIVDMAGRIPEE